jgi:predicted nucleic acid-binding protein
MIVVDSSAFVEYYRAGGEPEVRAAVSEAIAADQVAVNGIILVEIVASAAREVDREKLAVDFESFHWLELEAADFQLAVDLGFGLRRRGVRIPPTDLVVAASAIRAGAILYHADPHFDQVAAHSELAVRSFVKQ